MNKVILTGRLSADPELRVTAGGTPLTQFTLVTPGATPDSGNEYHNVVAWSALAQIAGRHLSKGTKVAIDGRLATRTWEDERGTRHWKTEVVASEIEILGGRLLLDVAGD